MAVFSLFHVEDRLILRVSTTNRSIWRGKMAKWQLYKYHPKQREFVWIGQTGHKIIRICMEFCNFCKAPNWTIFLKLGWVAFHSLKFPLKCLDYQSSQYKKLAPVLSRFCNGLCNGIFADQSIFTYFPREIGQFQSTRTHASVRIKPGRYNNAVSCEHVDILSTCQHQ